MREQTVQRASNYMYRNNKNNVPTVVIAILDDPSRDQQRSQEPPIARRI